MSNVCRDPWHDNNEPVDGPCPKCGEGNQAEARAQLDDHLTARDQHRLACGTCGKRLRDHIEGVTGHAFVRTFAPARAPLDVDRLVNAAHRMAKWTDTMEGENGGAFVYAMREASQAKRDTFRALRAFGIAITDRPPAALEEPTP